MKDGEGGVFDCWLGRVVFFFSFRILGCFFGGRYLDLKLLYIDSKLWFGSL